MSARRRFSTIEELLAWLPPVPEGMAFREFRLYDRHVSPQAAKALPDKLVTANFRVINFTWEFIGTDDAAWAKTFGHESDTVTLLLRIVRNGELLWIRLIASPCTPTELLLGS